MVLEVFVEGGKSKMIETVQFAKSKVVEHVDTYEPPYLLCQALTCSAQIRMKITNNKARCLNKRLHSHHCPYNCFICFLRTFFGPQLTALKSFSASFSTYTTVSKHKAFSFLLRTKVKNFKYLSLQLQILGQ
uniref:Uncharacterized protein n=1 Tax=Arundo donax TaxID=35708 RepID=A0A0A9F264_ARUDO